MRDHCVFEPRGRVNVKGIGEMTTYSLVSQRPARMEVRLNQTVAVA